MRAAAIMLAVLVVAPRAAEAQGHTRSISAQGRMAVVTDDGGALRVYAVEENGTLAWHSAIDAGAWHEVPAPMFPRPVCRTCAPSPMMQPQTGATALHTTQGDLVLTLAPASGSIEAPLWELAPLGNGPDCQTLVGTLHVSTDARLAAVEVASPGGMTGRSYVAVVAQGTVIIGAYQTHVFAQGICSPNFHANLRTNTIIAPAFGGQGAASDVSMLVAGQGTSNGHPQLFAVNSDGQLTTCAINPSTLGCTPTVIGTPGAGWQVSPGGVSAVTYQPVDLNGNPAVDRNGNPIPPEYRVAVGAHHTNQITDSLFIARSTDLVSWRWTRLNPVDADAPPELVRYGFRTPSWSSIDSATRMVFSVFGVSSLFHTIFVDDVVGNVLVPCLVPIDLPFPTSSTFTEATCSIDGGIGGGLPTQPHPSDLAPFGMFAYPRNDAIGPAVAGWMGPDTTSTQSADPRFDPNLYRAFTPGSLATTEYLYEMESVADGVRTPVWQNLLAPRDEVVDLAGLTSEFQLDEFFGDVIIGNTAQCSSVRSTDDGSVWSPAASMIGGFCGDLAIAMDGTGTAYGVVSLANNGPGALDIIRASGNSWTNRATTRQIPGANSNFECIDRPFIVGDHDRPHRIVITWAPATDSRASLGGATMTPGGRMAYCPGPADCTACIGGNCTTTPSQWCGPYQLSLGPGTCGGIGVGCQMARAPDGSFWLLTDSDRDCTDSMDSDGGGPDRAGFAYPFSVRRMHISDTCAAPGFDAPTCFYISQNAPTTPPPIVIATEDSWHASLSAARDSDRLFLAFRAYRDVATGGPCSLNSPTVRDSTSCQRDVLYVERRANGQWCNPAGTCTAQPNGMEVTNIHQASAVLSMANEDALSMNVVEHIVPAIAALDYGQMELNWYDFRRIGTDPATDFQVRVRFERFFDGSPPRAVLGWLGQWSPIGSYLIAPPNRAIGDVDNTAGARLHAHWARRFPPAGCLQPQTVCTTQAVTALASPRSPVLPVQ